MATFLLAVLYLSSVLGQASSSRLSFSRNATTLFQQRRQGTVLITKYFTLFSTGDASKTRTANNGFDCRIDLVHDLWGFCPTSVISATDCGLAGSCVDKHKCSKGCGFTNPSLTTFTCSESSAPFCSTALLTLPNNVGPFTYLACGKGPSTDRYMAFTTNAESSTTSTTLTVTLSPVTETSSTSTQADASTATSGSAIPQADDESQPTLDNNESPQPNHTAAIVGGVIGSIALLCLSGIAIVWLLKRNRNNSDAAKPDNVPVLAPLEQHAADNKEAAWTHYNSAGWGPQELPAYHDGVQERAPVELPTVMAHNRS